MILRKLPMKISKSNLWNWVFVIAAASACGCALLLAMPQSVRGTVVSAQSTQTPSAQGQSYKGMITDTHCLAKHSAAINMAASDCVRVCVHGGEKFALVDGETVYVLEGDVAAVKPLAGQRVKIVGSLNGNRISVDAVSPE